MLIFDHVTKVFGNGTKALEDVSFAIGVGEFVVLEGASGAGKTTLFRLALKDLLPSKGKVVVDGDNLARISSRNIPLLRRKIGVVFQDFKVLFDRTVAENIDLALDILGLPQESVNKRRQELLELTGLTDKQDDFPIQLSGGQLQRVIIARALAPSPKLLFADEPTGNLDVDTASSIINLLKDINEQGTTVILATHDTDLVEDLSPRHLVFEDGKLIKDAGEKPLPSDAEKKEEGQDSDDKKNKKTKKSKSKKEDK